MNPSHIHRHAYTSIHYTLVAHSCPHYIYCRACTCTHHMHSRGCLHIEACTTHMHTCYTCMCILHMSHNTFICSRVHQSTRKPHMYAHMHMPLHTHVLMHIPPHMHRVATHRHITYPVHTQSCAVTQAMCTLLSLRHYSPLLLAAQFIHLWRKNES